ncbi:uncharacterized protein LOC123667463 [Melitaea cinxia]|uniref:uncharacterized protein LOC123667463 n=1 Tax=Melitaea cinxia TaxID=113334 RepID=UPI001E2746D8|nr:uncharacterized protein LOC123667463 [Melitaea cinxia]
MEAEVFATVFWRTMEAYLREEPCSARSRAMEEWSGRWSGCGVVFFHLAQILTGHGCFGRYLCQMLGRWSAAACRHCYVGAENTAEHTHVNCPAWNVKCAVLSAVVAPNLTLSALLRVKVDSEEKWIAVFSYCKSIMLQKEAAEREREQNPNSLPIRRGRHGR